MAVNRVDVKRNVLSANDQVASGVRADLEEHGIFAVNLISSPGSGKTLLLERTLDALKGRARAAVLAGDVQTRRDADRLVRHGVPVRAIETGGGCHLSATQVDAGLRDLQRADIDLLFIENVGNLVCPSSFDLGESMKVVLLSVTEGEDKPLKYPAAFRKASAFVLTKVDLLPHLRLSVRSTLENARSVNPDLEVFCTSALTGEGIDSWIDWLTERMAAIRRSAASGAPSGRA